MENKNNLEFDVAIIGAGPAGLTCAIYASRGNLNVCFIDKSAPGGKMVSTYKIENWSGDESVQGFQLAQRMFNHAKKEGAKYIFGNVIKIENKSEFEHYLYLENGKKIKTKSIVIASGMNNKIPDIKNFDSFINKGVSYCVICDSAFYKNQPGAIIGGGDSAFEEAIYLSSVASKVYIFVRKDKPRAEKKIVNNVLNQPNIEVLYNAEVKELIGNDFLEKIKYVQNNQEKELEIKHLYPYIGFIPSNNFVKDLDIFDSSGFVITNDEMETNIPGIYAIGDIRVKKIRQIVTAASDGAILGKNLTNKIK